MNVIATLYGTRGAVSEVAEKLGVSVPAVSQWKRRGIPPDRLGAVEATLRDYLARCGLTEPAAQPDQSANHNEATQ